MLTHRGPRILKCMGKAKRYAGLLAFVVACAGRADDEAASQDEAALKAPSIYTEEFESNSWIGPFSYRGSSSNTTRVDGGYGGGHAIRTRFPGGSHYGTSMSLLIRDRIGEEPDRVFYRYYLRFAPNWKPLERQTGKLPGLADLNGTYRCRGGKAPTSSEPCWSARMMFRNVGTSEAPQTSIGFYTYHEEQKSVYGDSDMFSAEGYTPLQNGQWYCIEGMAKMNDPAKSDGELKGWVNGRPALDRRDVRFRKSERLHVQQFWYDIYYGGKFTAPSTMDIMIDRLALSTTRIGCDSSPSDPMWEPGAENEPFKDMPPNSLGHDEAIELLNRGITAGCQAEPNPMFCPRAEVTRSQLAAFLVRALHLPPAKGDHFDDDAGSAFEDVHNRLFEAKIANGCGEKAFCGDSPITRGQVAAFIARAFSLPPGKNDYFNDDDTSAFQDAINSMREAGITSGCAADRYCPDKTLTRAEMAVFLVRALER